MSLVLSDQLALVLKLALNDPNTVLMQGYAAFFAHYVAEHDAAYATADAALTQAAEA